MPKDEKEPEKDEATRTKETESVAESKDEPKDDDSKEAGKAQEAEGDQDEEEAPARSVPEPKSVKKKAEASASEPIAERSWLPFAIAAIVPALILFVLPPLTKSGLWDPYELNVADLARRIAANMFGVHSLLLEGADNSMPHLNDLGRPELPFTCIAYGFKMFGLHEWAGRLPLALWGFVGVIATYAWMSRLIDKRAGVYASIALCTMPLYFVQSRTMLGDIVTMSALAIAFGGFAVAAFDRQEKDATVARLVWLVLGALALVAGYYSRGLIIGVAVPLLGVGVAWGVLWVSGAGRRFEMLGDVAGALALLGGAIALYYGVRAIGRANTVDLTVAVGFMLKTPAKYPTYEYVIGELGPALAPWSAFVPFAFGRMMMTPLGGEGPAAQRESSIRVALLVGAAVALTAHTYIAAKNDSVPFAAPALLAAACAAALRDYERGAQPSLAIGVGTAVFLGVLHHDFHELPEKAYQAFAVSGAPFPESFKEHSLQLWTVALIGFAVLALLTWVERDAERKPFDPKAYLRVVTQLREAWDGMLALAYFAMIAGAAIAGLIIFLGVRLKWTWVPTISLQVRDGVLNAWWIIAVVPIVIIFGTYFACDLWLWAFHRGQRFTSSSITRGFEPIEQLFAHLRGGFEEPTPAADAKPTKKPAKPAPIYSNPQWLVCTILLFPLMILALPAAVFFELYTHAVRLPVAAALAIPSGVAMLLVLGALGDLFHQRGDRVAAFGVFSTAIGVVLCLLYYPALANQLSPKEVFESYERAHKGDEPLALFGVGGRTAAYYAGGQPTMLPDTAHAYDWLMAGEGNHQRRYLAVRADELPRLNQTYRDRGPKPAHNLPILDARSSQILLAASSLDPSDKNQSPLEKILLQAVPDQIQHRLDVNMEDKLMVLGYDLVDANGKQVDSLAPGRKVRMRTYYKVLGPVTTEWEAFIHIDGFRRRHNGDHKPLDGKYPFALWLKDDLIVDDYEFSLEPNFSPGAYTLYFGLFVGETRLKVTSGASDGENRIIGGNIRVQ